MMNPVDSIHAGSRRHADPPTLWMQLVAGSVLIHLVLLLIVSFMLARTTKQLQPDPISVEFVQPVEGQSGSTSMGRAIAPGAPTSTAANPLPQSSTPASSTVQQPPAIQQSPPESVTQPAPRPQAPTPTRPLPTSPSGSNPVPSSASPLPRPPLPAPSGSNVSPQNFPSSATGSTVPNPNSVQSLPDNGSTGPISSGVPLPRPSDISSSINTDIQPNNREPGSPTNQTPVNQNSIPAKFSASVTGVSASVGIPDIPDGSRAKLNSQPSNRTFTSDPSKPDCALIPATVSSFGQSVVLRIVVDDQGKVSSDVSDVYRSSGNPSYDQLVKCTFQALKTELEFTPAYDIKDGKPSYRFDNADIQIVISAAQ